MNPYTLYKQYKLQRSQGGQPGSVWFRLFLPLLGLVALIWFLVRVIPKPSRAAYPCQRVAFPLASSFIIWLIGIVGTLTFLRRYRTYWRSGKAGLALVCLTVGVSFIWLCLGVTSRTPARADDPVPNQPVGVAQGANPGRVVWVHDPCATDWDGPGHGYSWQGEHTAQRYVDALVSRAVRELAGADQDAAAWRKLFVYFNQKQGKGPVGYAPGEKITIKVNLTTCNVTLNSVNSTTYEKTKHLDKSDTSPQMIVAMLRQLVYVVGVDPCDIAVGDTLTYFPQQWWDICHGEFPEVTYFDKVGQQGRYKNGPSPARHYWSIVADPCSFTADFIPELYYEADYLINMPVLKGHSAGITITAKNHYGSYNRTPVDAGYYNLHNTLPGAIPATGNYRALVDIIGHPHMGQKTLLYLVDGLYGGYYWEGTPHKFQMDPFYNDWPSSVLASQDPIAIDSVGLDILWEEWPDVVRIPAVDDYLIEAAQADSPPSQTFYDPNGDGTGLDSLGVHERWNNAVDRQYSRNLGAGNGIELLYIAQQHNAGDLNCDGCIDPLDIVVLASQWLWQGQPGGIMADCVADGVVNLSDFRFLVAQWGCL